MWTSVKFRTCGYNAIGRFAGSDELSVIMYLFYAFQVIMFQGPDGVYNISGRVYDSTNNFITRRPDVKGSQNVRNYTSYTAYQL